MSQVAVGQGASCARGGNEVWCWGTNPYGLGDDGTNIKSTTPVRVVSAGATPFDGVSDLRNGGYAFCALKSADRSVWCWGAHEFFSSTPVQVSVAGVPARRVDYWDPSWNSLCFAGPDGVLYLGDGKASVPVDCP